MKRYPVDRGLAVPSARRRYPLDQMRVGDSFFVPFDQSYAGHPERYWLEIARQRISGSVTQWRWTRNKGFRYHVAPSEQDGVRGVRCWRLPDKRV